VGTSSRTVRYGLYAGPTFHSCPYLSGVIQRLGSSIGSSRCGRGVGCDRPFSVCLFGVIRSKRGWMPCVSVAGVGGHRCCQAGLVRGRGLLQTAERFTSPRRVAGAARRACRRPLLLREWPAKSVTARSAVVAFAGGDLVWVTPSLMPLAPLVWPRTLPYCRQLALSSQTVNRPSVSCVAPLR
jgi:hypothetical protein